MASQNGLQAFSLMDKILAEPKRFSALQAIRLISCFHAKGNERIPYAWNKIHIRQWLSLAFPDHEVDSIDYDERKDGFELTATNFGLYGTMGALPTFYTEELLDDQREDEESARGFLDILNNHLFHLLFEAEALYDFPRNILENSREGAVHLLHCLAGQPSSPFRNVIFDRLIGFFSCGYRSAELLESFLRVLFRRDDIYVEQCVERRVSVPKDQRCLLGKSNAALGENAVLGSVVRDVMGKFRIHVRRIEWGYGTFLPGMPLYSLLEEGIRRFLDEPLEYDLVLHNLGACTPKRLGVNAAIGGLLGTAEHYRPVRVFWINGRKNVDFQKTLSGYGAILR